MEDLKRKNVTRRGATASVEETRSFLPTTTTSAHPSTATSPSKMMNLFSPSTLMHHSKSATTSLFQLDVRDRKDASAKRRFRVNIPKKMMVILALVFLIAPLIVFLYKEAHIHENHDESHFKPEKYINVDTHDVMAHFLDHQQPANNPNATDTKSESVLNNGQEHSDTTDAAPSTKGNATNTDNSAGDTVGQGDPTEGAETDGESQAQNPEARRRHLLRNQYVG